MKDTLRGFFTLAVAACLSLVPLQQAQADNAFTAADIIERDGLEWLQPDLFTGLSWAEVSAVCPEGVCTDGTLNGYSMSGWRVANLQDVNFLFWSYMEPYVNPALAPQQQPAEYSYIGYCEGWGEDFYSDGWRETYTEELTNMDVVLVMRQLDGYVLGLYHETQPQNPGGALLHDQTVTGSSACGGDFVYSAGLVTDGPASPAIGTWFYRPKCVGCGCDG